MPTSDGVRPKQEQPADRFDRFAESASDRAAAELRARYDDALHEKIDTIAAGLAKLMERLDEREGDELREAVEKLRESIELGRRIQR